MARCWIVVRIAVAALAGAVWLAEASSAEAVEQPVTLQIEGGVGRLTSDVPGVACQRVAADEQAPTTCDFQVDETKTVTLTAVPGPGYRFVGYGSGSDCSTEAVCSFPVGATSHFVSVLYLPAGVLRVLVNGPGTVRADPAGLDSSGNRLDLCEPAGLETSCDLSYLPGTTVHLRASPQSAPTPGGNLASFLRWSPLDCVALVECTVTVGAEETTVAGSFDPVRVGVRLSGNGSVRSDPPGIACPDADCIFEVPEGTPVTLTATSAEAVEWTVGCEEAAGPSCRTVATADPTWVGVRFGDAGPPDVPPRVLARFRVLMGGDGHGTVRGRQIDCGERCAETYRFGYRERLVADPAGGSRFAGWRGACADDPVCVLPVGPVDAVRAIFDRSGGGSGGGGDRRDTRSDRRERRLAVRSVRAATVGRGRRRLVIVRILVNRSARASMRLSRGRRTLARRTVRLRAGWSTVRLRVPRRAHVGRYRLVVRVSSAGRTRSVTRAVRLPR